VEISWHFVNPESGFHAAALAVINIYFDRVIDEADLVTAKIVLNVNT
jgi:hypothetical protein